MQFIESSKKYEIQIIFYMTKFVHALTISCVKGYMHKVCKKTRLN